MILCSTVKTYKKMWVVDLECFTVQYSYLFKKAVKVSNAFPPQVERKRILKLTVCKVVIKRISKAFIC